jgi:hypothetical protein
MTGLTPICVRGVGGNGYQAEIRLVSGRMFRPG